MNIDFYQRVHRGEPVAAPLTARAVWRMTGPDRIRYLNGQITNDLTRLTSGHSLYAALTTPKGKMISDLFVHAHSDYLLLDAPQVNRDTVTTRLEKYLIADDVALEDLTESFHGLHVFSLIAPAPAPDVLIFHNPRFGRTGWDLFCFSAAGLAPLPLLDEETLNLLRLERGLARWGVEMDETTLPPEAGLDRHGIRYDKGCYVGQETIARIKSIGHVTKSLGLLRFDHGPAPQAGEALQRESKTIGKITSVAAVPTPPHWLALGYLQYPHHQPGQVVNTLNNSATVLELPLIPS